MITVEHLTKYYGDHLAVDDLSFEIEEGHVYGFLGPNGAGKSTTMNIITGCLSATEGTVLIDGHDIFSDPIQAKRCIGYLPEQPPLYMTESPVDYLRFVGEAKGLSGKELNAQIEKVIELTGISAVKDRRMTALSKGYKQRVGIAQAILGDPKLIILDEPTVGLDPLQIIEIRELIKSLGEDHTVIFSSHILSEVQSVCDRILMIAKGKLVAFDTPENLEAALLSSNEINITTDASEDEVRAMLEASPAVTALSFTENNEGLCKANIKTNLKDVYECSREIFKLFASSGKALLEMNLKRANLEEIFIELTEDVMNEREAESEVSEEIDEFEEAEAAVIAEESGKEAAENESNI